MKNDETLRASAVDKDRVAEFLQITFSAMDQAMTIYDSDLRLVAWNEKYQQLGFMPLEYIRYGASLPEAYKALARAGAFGPGDPEALAEVHISSLRDGPLIESELMLTPGKRQIRIRRFALGNGGICATLSDVTEEEKTQEQLRQSSKMDAIGRLTGGFAHDMNNVLAAVMGNIELEQLKNNGTTEFLNSAMEAAERGAELTHHLLAFARKQPLSPEIFPPGPLLIGLTSLLRPLLGETITIELVTDTDLCNVEADKVQFESVLVNLAINSRDAMPDGGKLTLEARNTRVNQDDGLIAGIDAGLYVCVSVTDTGTGMDQETVSKAFEPFFTTKPIGTGTGLGLAMAHGFIQQSSGQIKIHSEQGHGTTVKIYLPLIYVSDITDTVTQNLTYEDPEAAMKRILIVEDDPQFRATIANMLEFSGYAVTSVKDGVEALAVLRGPKEFEVLLTDVVLPNGLNGLEIADQALILRPQIIPIFMSGYSENANSRQGRFDTDVTLLRKPFRRLEVVQKIVNATSKKTALVSRISGDPP